MVALGLGLFPLSGFLLFLGWAFTDAEGIGYPPSWIALLAGFVLGVVGLTVMIMGIASTAEKR